MLKRSLKECVCLLRREKVVGIDLGTTNSVVAFMEGTEPTVVINAEGGRATPSVLAYTPEGRKLVGEFARRQITLNPINSYYSTKRFMGRTFTEVKDYVNTVGYGITTNSSGAIRFKCPVLGRTISPEEVASEVLRKLMQDASAYIGEEVTKAVVTVPAYFNDTQRRATKDAATIAGLEVIRIVNEPTAAYLGHALGSLEEGIGMVWDLGGGTFDVSLIQFGNEIFEVISSDGDSLLGGDDFTRSIYSWLMEEAILQCGDEVSTTPRSIQRVNEKAEQAKIDLSDSETTTVAAPYLMPDYSMFTATLTRVEFEHRCFDLLDKCSDPVTSVLGDADSRVITLEDIAEVILVGGSTRIPAIRALAKKLCKQEPLLPGNPDELVARGAAIQGAISTNQLGDLGSLCLMDVTPLTLGVELVGYIFDPIIPKNSGIPITATKAFTTSGTGSLNSLGFVLISMFQGERMVTYENKKLGEIKLPIPLGSHDGEASIDVQFTLSSDGLLTISATDDGSGELRELQISSTAHIDSIEVERLIKKAKINAASDKQQADLERELSFLPTQYRGCLIVLRSPDCPVDERVRVMSLLTLLSLQLDDL